MSIHEVSAEQLASVFHHYREALAPDFDCAEERQVRPWQQVPANQRKCMIAAARLTLLDIAAAAQRWESPEECRRYFAKPGEAEWGS